MTNISVIESLINRYVDCWKSNRPQYTGLFEDNDFGCESLQVFRNRFAIDAFNHDELCHLSALLTRSLRGQINRDHKIFWSWCSFLSYRFTSQVQLFQDGDWANAFRSLVNLLLAARKRFPAGYGLRAVDKKTRQYVNYHLLEVVVDKYLLSGPLAFSVLEGMLRRKSKGYLNNEGSIHTPFCVVDSKGKLQCRTKGKLNRIKDCLRLFEQVVTNDRGRPCSTLGVLTDEIVRLYPGTIDSYDLIDSWRNELVHGQEYWQNRVPVILNLICLLVIDEIEPSVYDGSTNELRNTVQWQIDTRAVTGSRSRWDFPPDLNH